MDTERGDENDLVRCEDGVTFKRTDGGGWSEWADFSLAFVAQLAPPEGVKKLEGIWVGECSSNFGQELTTRRVVISSRSFESGRAKLVSALRQAFGGGTFAIFGECSNKDIIDFYKWLKDDFDSGEYATIEEVSHVGYQQNGYWVLSDNLHILDGQVVEEKAQKKIMDDSLSGLSVDVKSSLLLHDPLTTAVKSYIALGQSMDANFVPFMLASVFAVWRTVRSVHSAESDEGNIGLITSGNVMNVGKSTSVKIIAKGMGIAKEGHPLLMAGGDGITSGTSLKVLMDTMTKTTWIGILDDARFPQATTEFLLQLQGGFAQGSSSTGKKVPRQGCSGVCSPK